MERKVMPNPQHLCWNTIEGHVPGKTENGNNVSIHLERTDSLGKVLNDSHIVQLIMFS